MGETNTPHRGGCLCGAIRYEADGDPRYMGLCYCADCRKASGSGYVPFMSFPASAVRFTGKPAQIVSRSLRGGEAVRNFCPTCGSLVYGGRAGIDTEHTIYAGTLDDPSRFVPRLAIFARDRAPWAIVPEGLTVYDRLPGL
jgi:hypothetical protein